MVLLDDRLVTVAPDGRATERERRVLKILRPRGRQYAEIVAGYSKDEKLDYFHAWSIGPDGHQFIVKDQEVHDEALGQWGILYDDLRARTVTPPGADPGGIIAYEVQRHVATYGAQEETWSFQRDIPGARWILEVDLPPNWNHYEAWLHHAPVAGSEIAPNHWRWELNDIPGIDLTDVPMAPSPSALAARMVVHYSAATLPAGINVGQKLAIGTTRLRRAAPKLPRRSPPSPAKWAVRPTSKPGSRALPALCSGRSATWA